jgi:hypothetical protein
VEMVLAIADVSECEELPLIEIITREAIGDCLDKGKFPRWKLQMKVWATIRLIKW